MASPKPLRCADQNLVGLAGDHHLTESIQKWAYLVEMSITGRHDGTDGSLATRIVPSEVESLYLASGDYTGIDPWICATVEAARSVSQQAP